MNNKVLECKDKNLTHICMTKDNKELLLKNIIEKEGVFPQTDSLITEFAAAIQKMMDIKNLLREAPYAVILKPERKPPFPKGNGTLTYCSAYWDLCKTIGKLKIEIAKAELYLSKEGIDISEERELMKLNEKYGS